MKDALRGQDVPVSEESSLWKGSPSQWLNLWNFTGAIVLAAGIIAGGIFMPLVFAALLIPLAWIIWKYLTVRCQGFELTTERLKITQGVINQKLDEVELYRVKDMLMVRPWWMRLTGLASVILETSDRSQPTLEIPAVRGGMELREQLRKQVELQRDRKRVREMDFQDSGLEGPVDAV
ncbi:PH domain-containing protein [Luteolibacter sp. SL250]|uniref:PH domain-containing protein n=1 Tax=Luteolibacter sp. SL250 TaxID=2995170 RepID=UPI00226E0E7D|nr:PH domain-containing protein [Luteolibacter sp. SL250]WAC20934.1 PH domain-containing protein [Luteolibacter sp. SL250]